ncbi:unnamed protein product [Caenorhabditis bovis]|uniref:Uncharacterized protein n=1 Tax=Caenorhabditis bovis TaxID=2654633 RepID=A0A8S1F8Y7_9PELO|nr:unnamed protein product [Caenorhabditis bovis]
MASSISVTQPQFDLNEHLETARNAISLCITNMNHPKKNRIDLRVLDEMLAGALEFEHNYDGTTRLNFMFITSNIIMPYILKIQNADALMTDPNYPSLNVLNKMKVPDNIFSKEAQDYIDDISKLIPLLKEENGELDAGLNLQGVKLKFDVNITMTVMKTVRDIMEKKQEWNCGQMVALVYEILDDFHKWEPYFPVLFYLLNDGTFDQRSRLDKARRFAEIHFLFVDIKKNFQQGNYEAKEDHM